MLFYQYLLFVGSRKSILINQIQAEEGLLPLFLSTSSSLLKILQLPISTDIMDFQDWAGKRMYKPRQIIDNFWWNEDTLLQLPSVQLPIFLLYWLDKGVIWRFLQCNTAGKNNERHLNNTRTSEARKLVPNVYIVNNLCCIHCSHISSLGLCNSNML